MPKRIAGSGQWADPARFLDVVAREIPGVLESLAELLTPHRVEFLRTLNQSYVTLIDARRDVSTGAFPSRPRAWAQSRDSAQTPTAAEVVDLNHAIVAWGSRWNLKTDWVLRAAAFTLHQWATRPIGRTYFPMMPWAGYVGRLKGSPRNSRDKRQLGDGIQILSVLSDHHLIAFVHWQVCGEGVDRVRRIWTKAANLKVAPTSQTVIDMMRSLACALNLEPRANRSPGRPRLPR
jgi:hypothetical protein